MESGIPGNGYPNKGEVNGTVHTHPDYDPNAFYLYDLGVVELKWNGKKPYMPKYGELPELNQLDALKKSPPAEFTAVGYGAQEISPVKIEAERVRMVSYPYLIQVNTGLTGDYSLLLSNNHATGGTCFGDSGGPNFFRDSNVIAGVTSYVKNGNCAGTGGVYRLDRQDALEWLCTDFQVCGD